MFRLEIKDDIKQIAAAFILFPNLEISGQCVPIYILLLGHTLSFHGEVQVLTYMCMLLVAKSRLPLRSGLECNYINEKHSLLKYFSVRYFRQYSWNVCLFVPSVGECLSGKARNKQLRSFRDNQDSVLKRRHLNENPTINISSPKS